MKFLKGTVQPLKDTFFAQKNDGIRHRFSAIKRKVFLLFPK